MAPLYFCPCIVYGATRFWLPPWVTGRITRGQTVEVITPALVNQQVIASVRPNQGAKIDLTVGGRKPELSQASVLAWFEEMWGHLSGEDKTFDLHIFSDRAWTGCALESQDESFGLEPLIVMQDTGLSIKCPNAQPDLTKQLTFTNFNAEYPYHKDVGRPLGEAVDPGTVITTMPNVQTLPGTFVGGQYSPTVAGQEQQFIVGGQPGTTWQLSGIQVTWADPMDASGPTTVRVSTANISTGGPNLEATVPAGQYVSPVGTGSITVAAGDTLYVYLPVAGGHLNPQYTIWLQGS